MYHRGAELAHWMVKGDYLFFSAFQLSEYLRRTHFCDKREMRVTITQVKGDVR
jgi:hypothetical protein